MKKLKELNPRAHAWLLKIPVKHWARAHFTGRAKSDVLLNNLCEVFNAKLKDGRDKPIITCLEYIRVYCMKRICIVQKVIDKTQGMLTPAAKEMLEAIKEQASKYTCIFAGSGNFQVNEPWMDQCVVNLVKKTCTCRKWELTGMPCKHAVRAMWDRMENREVCAPPEAWVHDCYKLETWKEVYSNKIVPISGRRMWKTSNCPYTLTPPKHHVQVGRPKKQRKKAAHEEPSQSSQSSKLSRKFISVTCGKCGNKGHNLRSCKGQGGTTKEGNSQQNLKRKAGTKEVGGKKKQKGEVGAA